MDRSTSLASSPLPKRLKVDSPSKSPSMIAETIFGSASPEPVESNDSELDQLRSENAKLRTIIDDIKKLLLNCVNV